MKEKLTHIDESGKARMVDVTEKSDTNRIAIAEGKIYMKKATLDMIESAEIAKGDVLAVARIAGIMSAKRTSELIPLCHTILLTKVGVDFESFSDDNTGIIIRAEVTSTGKTGVEMEALTAVSVSALTIYDMCKAVDRGMTISEIRLLEKRGGKSGTWKAD
jgi:cyclic pyranopterin phosphate synthase